MLRFSSVLAIGVCVLGVHAAQGAALARQPAATNPTLIARDSGIDNGSDESDSLGLSALTVQVDVAGNVAQTTVTAHFDNAGRDDLEGTFSLQLPDGAVVTGYALDVAGQMIDGVLAPPIRAKRAYESKVRAGIDPGVAEVARGNVFTTRVYPILHGRGRTVRLTFAAPFGAGGFTLPLATGKPSGLVTLSVRVREGRVAPNVTWPAGVKSEWLRTDEGFANEVVLRDRKLAGALRITADATDGQAFVTRHASGKRFVELRDTVAAVKAAAIPRSARVYWDRSLSRRDDLLEDELMALEQYLAAVGMSRVEVVPFGSGGAQPRVVEGATQAANLLRDLDLRGATSFDVLADRGESPRENKGAGKADICLMFTDGVSTIDARPELRLGCPLFVITSAADADLGYLELLARANGGAVLRLAPGKASDLVRQLRWRAPRIVDVRGSDGRALEFAPLPAAERGWALVAEAPEGDEVVVRIAGLAATTIERRYRIDAQRDTGRFGGAAALWAHDRVNQIAGDGRRQPELEALSRRYSVASPAMSFIVLEAPQDYVNAKMAPPQGYPKQLFAQYREAQRAAEEREAARRVAWLDEIVQSWKQQQEWWARDYRNATRLKRKADGPGVEANRAPAPASAAVGAEADVSESLEAVIVTGSRGSMTFAQTMKSVTAITGDEIAPAPGKSISVELAPWNPERPYLRALDAAPRSGFDQVFASQERAFGSLPVFYFDVAEWLFRKQRVAEAVEMLLSALELPARDTETIALVADRLLRYGQVDRAIWLYEEVCRVDPDRPQPARTLALALERRALATRGHAARKDLERSLALLTAVVMSPPEEQYRGIELVALMDANGIIPRLRALGTRSFALDARLIDVLDVDLRVVIEWNTGASDMDLWVDQPDGERSIYSNPQTAIGGRLSNDMTAGYGPEEYLLRRAIDGEYAIRVNVYGNDALNPNGATMVSARLTRNYGRPNESTETMEIELSPGDEGEKLVGRFKVSGKKGTDLFLGQRDGGE